MDRSNFDFSAIFFASVLWIKRRLMREKAFTSLKQLWSQPEFSHLVPWKTMSLLTQWVEKASAWWSKPTVYDTMVSVYAAMPALMVPPLIWIDAPYGLCCDLSCTQCKEWRNSLRGTGRFARKFIVDWSFPGKWTWCIMELVSPVMYGLSMVFVAGHEAWQPSQKLLTGLWMFHYFNRAVMHPYRAPSMAPIHAFTFLCSVAINVINGYTNGVWNARHAFDIRTPKVVLGVSIWMAGLVVNIYHDTILFNLRRVKREEKGGQRYFIPHGGLFELVSCPNYLGEAIEWTGFAIAAWPSKPAFLFALMTMANLFPRARRTHAWYKGKFPDYPPKRKAVIPFLF